jgi:hypothetical protein
MSARRPKTVIMASDREVAEWFASESDEDRQVVGRGHDAGTDRRHQIDRYSVVRTCDAHGRNGIPVRTANRSRYASNAFFVLDVVDRVPTGSDRSDLLPEARGVGDRSCRSPHESKSTHPIEDLDECSGDRPPTLLCIRTDCGESTLST